MNVETKGAIPSLDERLAAGQSLMAQIDALTEAADSRSVHPMPDLMVDFGASGFEFDQLLLERAQIKVEVATNPDSPSKFGLRATANWTEKGIAVTAMGYAERTRRGHTVKVEVGMTIHLVKPDAASDIETLEFAKGAGIRAVLPHIRSEIARLTGQTIVGQVLMAPVIVSLQESWEIERDELFEQLSSIDIDVE